MTLLPLPQLRKRTTASNHSNSRHSNTSAPLPPFKNLSSLLDTRHETRSNLPQILNHLQEPDLSSTRQILAPYDLNLDPLWDPIRYASCYRSFNTLFAFVDLCQGSTVNGANDRREGGTFGLELCDMLQISLVVIVVMLVEDEGECRSGL